LVAEIWISGRKDDRARVAKQKATTVAAQISSAYRHFGGFGSQIPTVKRKRLNRNALVTLFLFLLLFVSFLDALGGRILSCQSALLPLLLYFGNATWLLGFLLSACRQVIQQ
jgi:hypothetical protein